MGAGASAAGGGGKSRGERWGVRELRGLMGGCGGIATGPLHTVGLTTVKRRCFFPF